MGVCQNNTDGDGDAHHPIGTLSNRMMRIKALVELSSSSYTVSVRTAQVLTQGRLRKSSPPDSRCTDQLKGKAT